LFDDLDALLEGHPLPQGFTAEYPMSGNTLRHMHVGPSEKNGYLAFVALARHSIFLGL
jgi:hypothetical protein